MTHPPPRKLLVVGIGNDILSDDGIGPHVVEEIKKQPHPDFVEFQSATVGGLELLEIITGFDEVIFIDAIKTRGGIPGDVYLLTPESFRETLHLTNLHDINFINAIALGEKLHLKMPHKIHILAIEIVEDEEFGIHFSPKVQARYPEILREIKKFVARIIDQ